MNNGKRAFLMVLWSIVSLGVTMAAIEYGQYAELSPDEDFTLGFGVFLFIGGTLTATIIRMKEYW